MTDLLASFPVVIEIPVVWGDMDAFQHVNNTVYLRYFENARIAYFEALGYLERMDQTGVGPVLASTRCRFRIPLTYPDTVSVGAKTTEIQTDRFVQEYAVFSHRHLKIAAEGEGVLVHFNYRENKKATIPEELRQRILELERSRT
jgi:acyl-CoA thioester hydrolase